MSAININQQNGINYGGRSYSFQNGTGGVSGVMGQSGAGMLGATGNANALTGNTSPALGQQVAQTQQMQQMMTQMMLMMQQMMSGGSAGSGSSSSPVSSLGSNYGSAAPVSSGSGGGSGYSTPAAASSGSGDSSSTPSTPSGSSTSYDGASTGSSSGVSNDAAANAKVVAKVAESKGVDPVTAVADMLVESGGNNKATGDNGTSYGLFQLHKGGELGNLTEAQAQDPTTNAETALSVFAQNKGKYSDPGQLAAASERPADQAAYAKKVDAEIPEAKKLLGIS